MRAIFDQLTVLHIQIEEKSQRASVEVEFFQNGQRVETTLVLDNTDLNLLFAKLNAKGINISLSEDFTCFSTDEGLIYIMDFRERDRGTVSLDYFSPTHLVQQVRA